MDRIFLILLLIIISTGTVMAEEAPNLTLPDATVDKGSQVKPDSPTSKKWQVTGKFKDVEIKKLEDGGCQPVSYGCGSCCGDNVSGNYYINADCSVSCDTSQCGGYACE